MFFKASVTLSSCVLLSVVTTALSLPLKSFASASSPGVEPRNEHYSLLVTRSISDEPSSSCLGGRKRAQRDGFDSHTPDPKRPPLDHSERPVPGVNPSISGGSSAQDVVSVPNLLNPGPIPQIRTGTTTPHPEDWSGDAGFVQENRRYALYEDLTWEPVKWMNERDANGVIKGPSPYVLCPVCDAPLDRDNKNKNWARHFRTHQPVYPPKDPSKPCPWVVCDCGKKYNKFWRKCYRESHFEVHHTKSITGMTTVVDSNIS